MSTAAFLLTLTAGISRVLGWIIVSDKVINIENQLLKTNVFIFMEINLQYKMNRKFRIVYYSLMAFLILILSYHAYLFVSILFEMPDYGLSFLMVP